MQELTVTDQDIISAAKRILPASCEFDDERKEFLKCMKSRDVVACPGSGKTTSLLANLLILSSKMPFQDGRGVCILAHTNVAVNEIKSRLGNYTNNLFIHPNFIGTIQTFVNRFLASPMYRARFNKSPLYIDMDMYNEQIQYKYEYLWKAKPWLDRNGGVKAFGSYWFDPQDLSIKKNWKGDQLKLKENTPTYKAINEARYDILAKGFLSYNDSYSLGLLYLKHHPDLIKAFRKRFAFVFLDEAQDVDDYQFKILDKVFDKTTEQIVMYLGDPNQSIYQSKVKKDMSWRPKPNPIHFSNTMRFGKSIVKVLDTIRVDKQIVLIPNEKIESLSPKIITYNDDTILDVLQTFASIIHKNDLHNSVDLQPAIFKAVGRVGKDKISEGRLCLKSYYTDFSKPLNNKQTSFSNMISYLTQSKQNQISNVGARVYRKHILTAIMHVLRLSGTKDEKNNRSFTPRSFLNWLKSNNPDQMVDFDENLSKWIIAYHSDDITTIDFRDKICKYLEESSWLLHSNSNVEEFLTSNDLEVPSAKNDTQNTFSSKEGIQIKIGTIHSVKGETHTATLYLETYYQKNTDAVRLLPFLKGEYPKRDLRKAYHREDLKLAHVAMSRPTHLIAFGCNERNIEGHSDDLIENGWEILQSGGAI